ncbi:MAG TPA: glycosyltransferase family 4 protein [Actinomycetota bacterium]|nr:glycosyltransferase family 4 protein [Actinomycetota bacterium]
MRIAVLCSDTGIRVPDTKGASLHLVAVASALARIGHDVMLIGVAGHGGPPSGMEALLVRHPGWSKGIRRELRKLSTVERLVREARDPLARFVPDIVYERLALFGTAGVRLAAAVGAPHVIEVNALLAEEEARWRGLRLAGMARRRERVVLRSADLRVAVSDEVASAVEATAPGRPTAVLPNGVDGALFARLPGAAEARAFLGLPADAPVVGFAGSLRPWHGLEVAVEALRELPGVVLAVAGEGEVRAGLEERARRLGVADRVVWIGQLPHQLIPGFLAALDVAVLPYPALPDFAFSPLKLYEYLAAGIPVVASDLGQVRAVLEDGQGVLVPPGQPAVLADAVREVLGDLGAARERAARVRRVALEEHTWERRARSLTEFVQRGRVGALAG